VSSYGEKLAAERAARRVKGVKAIAEEIEVRLPSDRRSSGDEIAGRAVDILKWRVGLPAKRIGVKVEKGVATLTGDLDWRFQKTEAEGRRIRRPKAELNLGPAGKAPPSCYNV
jgi:osmotically-inducible protein OsmY